MSVLPLILLKRKRSSTTWRFHTNLLLDHDPITRPSETGSHILTQSHLPSISPVEEANGAIQ